MQLNPTAAALDAGVTGRRRLPVAAHAVLALVAAAVAVLLAAADAAASDELGSPVEGAIATVDDVVEPVVDPLAPILMPVMEPVGERLAPALDPVTPPVVGAVTPVLDPLEPALYAPDLPIATPRIGVSAHPPLARIRPVDELLVAEAAPPLSTLLPIAAAPTPALARAEGRVPLSREPAGPVNSPTPVSPSPAGAGTTLVAALLVGLAMAIPSGWAMSAVAARLRPMGLTLAPPVPPG